MPSSRTLRPESERYYYCIKYRVTFIFIMLFFGASFILLLVWGVSSALLIRDGGEGTEEESAQELRNSNKNLHIKMEALERKLNLVGEMLGEVQSDCNFYGRHHHTPKVERNTVELKIEDWETKIKTKSGLDAMSLSFKAGELLGPLLHTSWTLYLSSSSSKGVNVHLALDKWDSSSSGVNVGKSLWAAFSVQVLRLDGSIAISESHPVTNVMESLVMGTDDDETWPEIVIHNFLTLESISPLLINGSLTLRAELELFGQGYRVYKRKLVTHPQSDTQKVIFAVDKKSLNPSSHSSNNSSSKPLAFSKFELVHPWGAESKWGATVVQKHNNQNLSSNVNASDLSSSSLTFSLALMQVWDDEVEWDQFWATFTLDVVQQQGTTAAMVSTSAPLHDFMSIPQLTLDNIYLSPGISNSSTSSSNSTETTLEFIISLTVFNRNARFYIDLR